MANHKHSWIAADVGHFCSVEGDADQRVCFNKAIMICDGASDECEDGPMKCAAGRCIEHMDYDAFVKINGQIDYVLRQAAASKSSKDTEKHLRDVGALFPAKENKVELTCQKSGCTNPGQIGRVLSFDSAALCLVHGLELHRVKVISELSDEYAVWNMRLDFYVAELEGGGPRRFESENEAASFLNAFFVKVRTAVDEWLATPSAKS